ncbi:hypothetical protein COO03_15810 [Bacillus sp. AFS098217]|nr:hypothetical protein COO03_15810 [Bacillus sp. AFS098217]
MLLCRIKHNLLSHSPFVFTLACGKKGPNRFYAWLDALFHVKERSFYVGFSTHIYISILVFRHLNPCYVKQKVTYTRLLFLFLLRMWQKKALTASMHG